MIARDNVIHAKSYAFAIRIVNAYKFLADSQMNIALKEANETSYWLSLLKDTHYLEDISYESISVDCNELIALLVSIVKSMKQSLNR